MHTDTKAGIFFQSIVQEKVSKGSCLNKHLCDCLCLNVFQGIKKH